MLNKEMKIKVKRNIDNPFREGSGAHKRAGAVMRANGKTVAAALRGGARPSTVHYLKKAKIISLHP